MRLIPPSDFSLYSSGFAEPPKSVEVPRISNAESDPTGWRRAVPDSIRRARRARAIRIEAAAYGRSDIGAGSLALVNDLRGSQPGVTGYVVCNGPSINRTDLSVIGDAPYILMNRGYLLQDRIGRRPTAICASDELVLRQFGDEILRQNSMLFLPKSASEVFARREDVAYLAWDWRWQFADDLRLTTHHGYTITFWALQVAHHLGWGKVIIVGLDHSFTNAGNNAGVSSISGGGDANHFDPDYFPAGSAVYQPVPTANEYSYILGRSAFESSGRRIVDCTPGGACQVFQKGDLISESTLN